MTQDLFYYESGYIDNSYFVYTADAESAVTSTATMTVAVSVIKSADAALEVTTEIQATISHIEGADLFAFTEAALSAEVSRLRDNNIEASAVFDVAADAVRGIYVSAQADSAFAISAGNSRVRYDEAAIDAAFSLTADADVIIGGTTVEASGDWTVTATQTVSANRTRDDSASLESIAELSIDIGNTKGFASDLSATTTQEINAVKTTDTSSALDTTATVSVTISHIHGADLQAFSDAALTVDAVVTRQASSAFEITATQSATALMSAGLSASLSSNASVTAVVEKIPGFAINLSTAFDLTATALRIQESNIDVNSESSLDAQAIKTAEATISASSNASLSATISHIHGADLSAFSDAALTATPKVTRTTASALSSEFTQSSNEVYFRKTSAAITTTATVTALLSRNEYASSSLSVVSSFTVDNALAKLAEASLQSDTTSSISATKYGSGAHKFSNTGDITLVTDVVKFGSGAVRVNGQAYLSTPDSDEWDIGSTNGAYTIDFWFYPTASSGTSIPLFGDQATVSSNGWTMRYSGTNIIFAERVSNGNPTPTISTQQYTLGSVNLNAWNHIRLERQATTGTGVLFAYINGTRTYMDGTNNAISLKQRSNTALFVGTNISSSAVYYLDGLHIQEGVVTNVSYPSTITVPTSETSYGTAYSKLLLNFNGNYIDQSLAALESGQAALTTTATISATPAPLTRSGSADLTTQGFIVAATGRIRPEVAALDSSFALTASATKVKNAQADLSSQFELTAQALDLDLGQVALTSTASLSVTPTYKLGLIQNLQATSSLSASADQVYLTLAYGSDSTSGYITTTGSSTGLVKTFSYEPSYSNNGWYPVQTNFWFKLDRSLAEDETVTIYNANGNDITITGTATGHKLQTSIQATWTSAYSTDPRGYPVFLETFYRGIYLPTASFDPTVWHNVHIPLKLGIIRNVVASPTGHSGPTDAVPVISIDNNSSWTTYKNEGLPGASILSWSATAGRTVAEYNPKSTGGDWGANSNPTTVYLDQVWIKALNGNGQDSTVTTNATTASEFIDGTWERSLPSGTTASGVQADIWLPFRNLNDLSNLSPTWNYTKNNIVSYGLTKYGQASISSAFTQTTAIARVRPSVGYWNAEFTQSTTGLRLRNPGAKELTSTASLSAAISRTRPGSSSLTVTATQVSNAIKTAEASLSASSAFTQTVSAVKYRPGQASVLAEATQTTNAVKTTTTPVTIEAQVTQNSTALRIKQLSATLEVTGSELAVVAKTGQGLIHAQMTATMQINAVKSTEVISEQTATTSLAANAISVNFAQASLTSQSSIDCSPTYLRHTEAALTAQVTQTTNAVKTARISKALTSTATQTVTTTNSKITGYSSNLSAEATIVSNNQIVKLAQAALNSQASVLGTVYTLVRFEADLQVQGFTLTAGKVIHIDEYNQIRIRPEVRLLSIKQETREITVLQETRVNIIKGTPAL